jgi:leucyl-tRNA synthetase
VTLAPEHPLVSSITAAGQRELVDAYVRASASRSDLDRTAAKEKTGVFTGSYCEHPLTGEKIPVWVGDYVLGSYGSGAVMAVPAHDARDFEFAGKFGLEVRRVVDAPEGTDPEEAAVPYTKPGVAVASTAEFDGLATEDAKAAVSAALAAKDLGGPKVQYKLRDWVFSRQRYWGEPIPIYFPVTCGPGVDPRTAPASDYSIDYGTPIPVDEAELPLTLPDMEDFAPGDDPAGCLARAKDWRFFQKGGEWFARETNTMPQVREGERGGGGEEKEEGFDDDI